MLALYRCVFTWVNGWGISQGCIGGVLKTEGIQATWKFETAEDGTKIKQN